MLATGATDLPERQRTLRGAVEWSYELLDDPERRLLARLAVFAGGWTLDAAEEVCRPAAELGVNLLDGLSSLADKSLVKPDEAHPEPRFGMLQVIREFALEKLDAGGDAEAVRRRHAEHVMSFTERAGPELVGFEMRAWNHRLQRDEENIRSALRWAIESGDAQIGLRTASAIWRYWHYWGVLREGRDWLQTLLEQSVTQPDTANQAKGFSALASIVYWLGDMRQADEHYNQALAIYRRLGDELRVTQTIEALAWSDVGRGEYQMAMARSSEALKRYRDAGDAAGVARVDYWMKGGMYMMGLGGSAEEALAVTRTAIETARQEGNAWDMANSQGEVADIYRRMGDIERAVHEFNITTDLYYGMGYLGMLPWLKLLARLEVDRGNAERAATLAAVAQRAVEDLGGELPEEMTQVGDPLADARAELSDEAYSQAVERGRSMTFGEAVAFVLEA